MNKELHVWFKIWLSKDDFKSVFGDGKYKLLNEINRTGSLKKASENLKISYRKAWGDLKKAEKGLGLTLLEKTRGGEGGGQTILTEKGIRILKAYRKFRIGLDKYIEQSFEKNFKKVF